MRPPEFPTACIRLALLFAAAADALAVELRCYCNLPRCIAQGYMCKTSRHDRCFFMLQRNRVTVQGCTDLLPAHRKTCDYAAQAPVTGLLPLLRSSSPAVVCCNKDMCNHDDYAAQLENRIETSLRNRSGTPPPPRIWYVPKWHPQSIGITEQEVWLKAAVIGVPIAGGFIMMVLLFIAVRILRQDNKLRRKPQTDLLLAHPASAGVPPAPVTSPGGAWLLKRSDSIV